MKKIKDLLKQKSENEYEISLKEMIKEIFGEEILEKMIKEYSSLKENQKPEWQTKLLNILKKKMETE